WGNRALMRLRMDSLGAPMSGCRSTSLLSRRGATWRWAGMMSRRRLPSGCARMTWYGGRRDHHRRRGGSPAHNSPAMSRSRVSSPRAANTGALLRSAGIFNGELFAPGLGRADMLLDVLYLPVPPPTVHSKHLEAARHRDLVNTRFDNSQQRTTHGVLQLELDERGGLAGIVHLGVDRCRMPAPGQQLLRLGLLDRDLEHDVLVSGIGHLAGILLAGGELLAENLHPEPAVEFLDAR